MSILKFKKKGIVISMICTLLCSPTMIANAKVISHNSLQYQTITKANGSLETPTRESVQTIAEQKVKNLLAYYGATSVQYALMDDGKIVLSGTEGYADKSKLQRPNKDTLYGIASISKMFTTTAVMQLVEQGKIDLDDPVTKYIAEFKMADERYKKITVRMLLNHSSGLLGSTFENALLLGDKDHSAYDNFLAQLKTQRLKANPGEYSVYCNDGFTLAELIVERVSKMTFTDYLRQHITSKIGMDHTYTPRDCFPEETMAKIYKNGVQELPYENLQMIGSGGIISTAEDMCRFSQTFMDKSNGLLSETSVALTKNKEYENGMWLDKSDATVSYGLGWDNVEDVEFKPFGIQYLSKDGDLGFYHSTLITLPQMNISMCVLTSGSMSIYNKIVAKEVLFSYLIEKGLLATSEVKVPEDRAKKASTPKEIEDYSGMYANLMGTTKVSIKDGVCKIEPQAVDMVQTFEYRNDGWFKLQDKEIYITFVKEENDKIYIVAKASADCPMLGTMYETNYLAQKLEKNPITEETKEAWKRREGKQYLLISEKYSSEQYANQLISTDFKLSEEIEGYIENAKIIDANNLQVTLQIPISNGRDNKDVKFFSKKRVEYAKIGGMLLISEDGIRNLSNKKTQEILIPVTGYARYYKITSKTAGKKMTVKLPRKSTVVVYDKEGTVLYNAYTDGKNEFVLPSEGYVQFVGSPITKFQVKLQKNNRK